MTTVIVSTKGQIVLPADIRRRLGLGPGACVQVLEEPDGVKLRGLRSGRGTRDSGGPVRVLDTSVLARFFVDDADDKEAARQRPAAIAALSERAHVPVTVLLEFDLPDL